MQNLTDGIPQIFYSGKSSDGGSHVIVMQLLKDSLENLQKKFGGRFTPKTVYMLGIQMVSALVTRHFVVTR